MNILSLNGLWTEECLDAYWRKSNKSNPRTICINYRIVFFGSVNPMRRRNRLIQNKMTHYRWFIVKSGRALRISIVKIISVTSSLIIFGGRKIFFHCLPHWKYTQKWLIFSLANFMKMRHFERISEKIFRLKNQYIQSSETFFREYFTVKFSMVLPA